MKRERGALDLLEDALALCAGDLPAVLFQTACGAVWVAALALAHLDLLRSPGALGQAGAIALGLTAGQLLWYWMDLRAAAAFRRRLGAQAPAPSLTLLLHQAALMPWSLLGLPLAALSVLGFAPLSAFYENLPLLDDGTMGLKSLAARAWAAAGRAPLQLQTVQAMLAALYTAAFINVAAGVVLAAALAKQILGIDTQFSMSPTAGISGTFFILTLGGAWAVTRPLTQAVHALRLSEGAESGRGEDLWIRFRALDGHAPGALSGPK